MSIPTMDAVDSSNIVDIGYDPETKQLYVGFKGNTLYEHDEVPEALWHEFQASDSKGRFYAAQIKNQFVARKVDRL